LRKALIANADELLTDAREELLDVGEIVYDSTRTDPSFFTLVVEGLVRVYCVSAQGRQVTTRYGIPGQVIGLPFVLAPHLISHDANLGVQAALPCRLLHFSPRTFRRVAEYDVRNMWRLFKELADSMVLPGRSLALNVFQPIRSRVARHLLELSERRGDQLVVTASQQDIADAVGSVREVISRIVVQLRDEGLIRREDNAYVLVDCPRLRLLADQE
jgi:CRP-like cAMP-binding protein